MGFIFEEICRQYLYQPEIYTTLPFLFGKMGRWWGTNPQKHRQEEIDIVALGDNQNQILFGECKWQNAKTDVMVFRTLLERGGLFHCPEKYFYVFSKAGFEKNTEEIAKQYNIKRISFSEM